MELRARQHAAALRRRRGCLPRIVGAGVPRHVEADAGVDHHVAPPRTATGTSYAFVLNPLVTVVLAAFLTDEIISLLFLAGAGVVLLGVYVGALRPPSEAAKTPEEDIHSRPAVPTCV